MLIGYARTSTVDQVAGFEAQIKELLSTGCEKIFREQVSSIEVRTQLQSAIEFIREGDTLIVTKLDRLARSVSDLMKIIQELENKKVGLRLLNLGMDTPWRNCTMRTRNYVGAATRRYFQSKSRREVQRSQINS